MNVSLFLISQHCCIYASASIGDGRSCVLPYFPSNTEHVLCVLLRWFVWWKVSGRTGAIIESFVSGNCLKQFISFLTISLLGFFSRRFIYVLFCNHTIAHEQLQLVRISALFSQRDEMSVWSLISQYQLTPSTLTLPSTNKILLPRYINCFSNTRGLFFDKKIATSRLKPINSVLIPFT